MARRWIAAAVAAMVLLAGCSGTPDGGRSPAPDASAGAQADPPSGVARADDAAKALATALAKRDVSKLPMQSSAAAAQEDLTTILAGMDKPVPTVTPGKPAYLPDGRTAEVPLTIAMDVGVEPWTYKTKAKLKWIDEQWRVQWSPSIVHEKLDDGNRLRRVVTNPTRAPINDKDGLALVEEITLYQVGIDKSATDQATWGQAARTLAGLLDMDAAAYAEQVEAGGPKQFVIAKTLRQEDIPPQVADVKGVLVQGTPATVGPSDGFAASLLGSVGHPTAEMITKSKGRLTPDDVVGLSGLQSRYDEQLGGVPGVRVEVVHRKGAEKTDPVVVFSQEESVGSPITVSLDRALQQKAEDALKSQSGVASLVAIDLATGGVAAAANSPKAGAYPYATYGRYAPGSTFKVVSALAMLRKGATASSPVECPATHTVGGHQFGNHTGYAHTGRIRLSDAIAYSCNTVFTRAGQQVTAAELHAAAASLGVGTDYDAGFRSYFGTVDPQNAIDRSASMIGQGQVTMSPLAMAAMTASVAKGKTVIPWLVDGHKATSKGAPLTAAEAKELRIMMAATVDHGTGRMLAGVAKGAKSGTAEFGQAGKLKTHAWMVAFNDRYAVAAFVEEGDSGGKVAAPLVKQLLS
ncbi:penicillin-binding transpeptidase domain-containing protein [uncultured Tessaracoccus sp.]|uniref:penicillin-binding transpeptidase domain-containing protein n=1 Tax=uncultured Tessaracoccus sp. TaxID=905023 RepID=UPI0025FD0136|nr:penicillin-binding transpeptidase domain-containing protein [uncultured Tessaracoccus sp.]